ncbi:MAG TPA: 3-hydroxyacyl-CoA dehydrogenase NAD-binding domain-containing protein [Steroidobacteraceae bacterium]|nr:3-hydroxyacyl-CoA dehydrogenase NAD-binding domain-containing protein [Steroidobacteraceae bacterium]
MPKLNAVTDLTSQGGIAVLTIDSPPVNALSTAVRAGLDLGFRAALADGHIQAIVLICSGRTFIAGADISEFGKPDTGPDFPALMRFIENASKPVVAAIHGTALGGGLEVALICHYRVAVPAAKLGLPEVKLGLLPGGGGTQRLPRIVGVEAALDLITSGRSLDAAEALAAGLLDAVVEESHLREQAIAFAQRIVAEKRPLKRIRDLDDKVAAARGKPEIFTQFRRANARAFRGFKAPENIIKSIEAAVTLPFDAGMQRELELFTELLQSPESAAQRYAFFAEREAAKVPDLPAKTPTLTVGTVGVVGAGTMGGGIAMCFVNAGMPVTLIDAQADALERGMQTIRKNYENTARRGKLTAADVQQRMALLTPSLDFSALASADLVVEAVYENLDSKKDVFRRLDAAAKPEAILASNTSYLDLDAIATATRRADRVVGLHFFSPANVMRLLEIVRGAKTSPEVLATSLQIGRKIGKAVVVSGVAPGFIANRTMSPRKLVARELILEGPRPWDVDRVLTDFGFPMGPFAVTDLVGLDVIDWDRHNSKRANVHEALCEMGRWGQKKGAGYYDYDSNRRPTPSPEVVRVIEEFAAGRPPGPRRTTDAEILESVLYPVVNEGTKVLEQRTALRASDIDVALMIGYGWPVFTGGPLFWADTVGLAHIVERLDALARNHGPAYQPTALLRKLAASGGTLHTLRTTDPVS